MYSCIDDFQTADRPNMSLFRDSFWVSCCSNNFLHHSVILLFFFFLIFNYFSWPRMSFGLHLTVICITVFVPLSAPGA